MLPKIKATLKTANGVHEIEVPMKQNDFDKALTAVQIRAGSKEEYSIEAVTSNMPEINESLSHAKDIEEINYLAQRLDSFDNREIETYNAIVKAQDASMTMPGLINLTFNLWEYNIEPSINDIQELGEKYVEHEAPDLPDFISENIDYEAVGMDIHIADRGEFTDIGYIKNFNDAFENVYNGQFFPDYDFTCDYILKGTLTLHGDESGVNMLLPASETVVARALHRLGADSLDKCDFKVYSDWDFKLMDKLVIPAMEISTLNQIAEKLESMPSDKNQNYIKTADSNDEIGSISDLLKFTEKFMDGSYERENTTRRQMEETVRGLTTTAMEKVCVFGDEDAKPYVDKLREQVTDLVQFWNLDEHFIDQFDMDVADVMEAPQAKMQREKPDCPLIGENGNIFNLMSIASKTLKRAGMPDEAKEMCEKIKQSGSYNEALNILGEYVNITDSEQSHDMEQGMDGPQMNM